MNSRITMSACTLAALVLMIDIPANAQGRRGGDGPRGGNRPGGGAVRGDSGPKMRTGGQAQFRQAAVRRNNAPAVIRTNAGARNRDWRPGVWDSNFKPGSNLRRVNNNYNRNRHWDNDRWDRDRWRHNYYRHRDWDNDSYYISIGLGGGYPYYAGYGYPYYGYGYASPYAYYGYPYGPYSGYSSYIGYSSYYW